MRIENVQQPQQQPKVEAPRHQAQAQPKPQQPARAEKAPNPAHLGKHVDTTA